MRQIMFLFLMISLASCGLFQSKEDQIAKNVTAALKGVDWNDIDSYPLFDECEPSAPKIELRECFATQLHKRLQVIIHEKVYKVDAPINDTLLVSIMVDEDGFIFVQQISENKHIEALIPGFSEDVRTKFRDSTVIPAHKGGTDVKIRLNLPIILNTQ